MQKTNVKSIEKGRAATQKVLDVYGKVQLSSIADDIFYGGRVKRTIAAVSYMTLSAIHAKKNRSD